MRRSLFPLVVLCLLAQHVRAQHDIEDVVVETYYISDASDATDTIGGGLVAGSRTFRIYLDLCDSCSLRALYGDADHLLRIGSTAPFFNHLDRGKTYGHEINNSALDEGTTALDSWLAMGAASNQRDGILKDADMDGSFVGGANNDGGSAEVPAGLLVNADAEAGLPLTQADGLVPLVSNVALPPNFNVFGDDPTRAFKDSTLLSAFVSHDFRMGCSTPGVKGPTSANRILVAQVTTAGELSFQLNVEVEKPDGSVIKYVASDSVLNAGETANGLLNYPPVCGCTDPHFLEYDPAAGCDDGSCHTTIVFGCLDTLACNFDPNANFHVQQLCCYGPSDCNGLDVSIVCPDVGIVDVLEQEGPRVYPNPVHDVLNVELGSARASSALCAVMDMNGRVVVPVQRLTVSGRQVWPIDISDLAPGTYVLRMQQGTRLFQRVVVKA